MKSHLRGKRPLAANAADFDPGSETRFHTSSSSILHGSYANPLAVLLRSKNDHIPRSRWKYALGTAAPISTRPSARLSILSSGCSVTVIGAACALAASFSASTSARKWATGSS